ncbi:hypothetical protein CL617_04830 [archaeon]|nr:hypothetical protein [archaeon]|tara:strand:+ start:4679 stop:4876 length:198 start_codon:yes stop_codon:yes gene_type:complete
MVDKNFVGDAFVSYKDDDDTIKNQYVVIIKKDEFGITFHFKNKPNKDIFLPWNRILKIKTDEVKE